MTPDTLRELLAAIAPEPWNDLYKTEHDVAYVCAGDGSIICFMAPENEDANAALIVALRNAAPALLARLEAAERVVEAAREVDNIVSPHYFEERAPLDRLAATLAAYDNPGA